MKRESSHFFVAVPEKSKRQDLVSFAKKHWGENVIYTAVGLNSVSLYKNFPDFMRGCVVNTFLGVPPMERLRELQVMAKRAVATQIMSSSIVQDTFSQKGKKAVFLIKTSKEFSPDNEQLFTLVHPEYILFLAGNYAQLFFEKAEDQIVPSIPKGKKVEIYHNPQDLLLKYDGNAYYVYQSYEENEDTCLDTVTAIGLLPDVIAVVGFIQES